MYQFFIATTQLEKDSAFALVQKIYSEQGYIPKKNENTFRKFLFASPTKVFLGYYQNQIFATISLIPDSSLGLPMDVLYQKELGDFRRQHKRLAEVSQYAVDQSVLQEKGAKQFTASIPMLEMVFESARAIDLDYLCITINPKHDVFYQSLGFISIGEPKFYPAVNNAPALARIFDMRNSQGYLSTRFG